MLQIGVRSKELVPVPKDGDPGENQANQEESEAKFNKGDGVHDEQ